jgi:hypothetical protein
MNVRFKTLLALAMAGALAACGGDKDTPDAGLKQDAGINTTPDTGVGETDSGTTGTDSGPRADAGRPDSGTQPACPANTLGCECQPGGQADPQGTCLDEGHICLTFSEDPATSICVAPCDLANGNADCEGQIVANRQNRPASTCRGGLLNNTGTCTETTVDDGEECAYGALAGERLAACPEGSACFIGFGTEEPYLGSCGRTCAGDTDCAAPRPVCLTGVLNSTVASGICTDELRGPGSACRPGDITGLCPDSDVIDFGGGNRFGRIQCVGLLSEEVGHCVELCDTRQPGGGQCPSVRANSPNLQPACASDVFNIPNVGVCEDNCSNFPEDCNSQDQNCASITLRTSMAQISWCLDILPDPLSEFNGSAGDDCASDPDTFRCPKGTLCVGDGSGGGLCARGCNATVTGTAAASQCAASPIMGATCMADMGQADGICAPAM